MKTVNHKCDRRMLAILLSLSLMFSMFGINGKSKEVKAATTLSNPTTDSNGVSTWDCIYFGNYYQSNSTTKEPIKWRVLSVDGDDAFLLADQNLDCQPYNEENTDVTWETCTLRTWLNSTFLTTAFNTAEQSAIKSTTVMTEDIPYWDPELGNKTIDKVYLLSIKEASNAAYGFNGEFNTASGTREAKNTAYANERGAWASSLTENEGNGWWWLRSPGNDAFETACVNYNGYGYDDGKHIYNDSSAVRPALHLNLSSSTLWSYAGKVSAQVSTPILVKTPAPTVIPESTVSPTEAPDKVTGLSNPTISDSGTSTWDCVYFGNYYQSNSTTKEPIKWRVLSVDGNDAFLLADQNIASLPYNFEYTYVTWKTCTLRTWLNSEFLTYAFNSAEQSAIKSTTVVNDDNPFYAVEGGNNTVDKVYLLSIAEASNTAYGFNGEFNTASGTREAKNAADNSGYTSTDAGYEGNGGWWLRSSGDLPSNAAYVTFMGWGLASGTHIDDGFQSVRPAMHLDLSDTTLWTYAGKVSAEGGTAPTPTPTPEVSPAPAKPEVSVAPTVPPTVAPTLKPIQPESSAAPTVSPIVAPTLKPTQPPAKAETVKPAAESKKELSAPEKVNLESLKKGKKVLVEWKAVTNAKGYQLQYSTDKNFKKKKSIHTKKTKYTLKNLKKKKTYYIRICAYRYEGKEKVYGKWSGVKKIKVKK